MKFQCKDGASKVKLLIYCKEERHPVLSAHSPTHQSLSCTYLFSQIDPLLLLSSQKTVQQFPCDKWNENTRNSFSLPLKTLVTNKSLFFSSKKELIIYLHIQTLLIPRFTLSSAPLTRILSNLMVKPMFSKLNIQNAASFLL